MVLTPLWSDTAMNGEDSAIFNNAVVGVDGRARVPECVDPTAFLVRLAPGTPSSVTRMPETPAQHLVQHSLCLPVTFIAGLFIMFNNRQG